MDRQPQNPVAEIPPTQDELLLGQVAQSLLATRAQAVAVVEQVDASMMVIRALQDREAQRSAAAQLSRETPRKTPPRTFGMNKSADTDERGNDHG